MRSMDLFLRGRSIARLSEHEREVLEAMVGDRRRLPPRATLVERGEPLRQSTMLVDGFMIRYIDDCEGRRQVVAFHVPGDFVDLHGFPLAVLDHSIATLTDVRIATVPHSAIERLAERDPTLARKLWTATLLDAATHRGWLFRLGRLGAVGRIAHFFAETEARLRAIGLSDGRAFPMPVTQTDLGDIVGLTGIHVNRVLRTLREERICTLRSGRVEILDPARLARAAQLDTAYLYLDQADDAAAFTPSGQELADG